MECCMKLEKLGIFMQQKSLWCLWDYLLDIEFAETVSELDNGLCVGSHLENSSSESHSPGFSGNDNGAVGI